VKSYVYFDFYLAQFFLELGIFQPDLYTTSKHTFLFNNFLFFLNSTIYEIMWKLL